MKSNPTDNVIIQAHLMDFYESMFPVPSQFELPPYYRNKYLHLNEFLKYWRMRKILSAGFYLVLITMVLIVIANVFNIEVAQRLKKMVGAFKRTLQFFIPNVLFFKKAHRKRRQSETECENKYDV